MCSRATWLWLLVPGALGLLLIFLLRPSGPSEEPPRPASPPRQELSTPSVDSSELLPPPPSEDALIRKWQRSILHHDRAGVEQSSAAFQAQEEEYRGRLVKLSSEDPEPRIRAFTVTLLSRFRSPPPEEYFVRALGDPGEPPRESAIAALGKLGTRACLEALDRSAASDPAERLRGAAAAAAKAVRAK